MKYLFIIIISILVIGYAKEPILGDLKLSKWEENIPNYIVVDSSDAVATNPSDGDIWVYISFNESLAEQEWDNISAVHAVYRKTTFPVGSTIYKTVSFNNGEGVFSPLNTYNNSNYDFQFYIEFNNGRTSLMTPIFTVVTPPF